MRGGGARLLAACLLLCGLSGQTWAWAPSLLKMPAMQGRLRNQGAAVVGGGMLGAGPASTRILPGGLRRGGAAGAISMGVPVMAKDVGAAGTKVAVYDKTITQHQVDLTPEDKLRIAERLAEFGIQFIEGGWPAARIQDRVFFDRARKELAGEARSRLVAMAAAGDFDVSSLASCETAKELVKSGAGVMGVAGWMLASDGTWLEGMGDEDLAKIVKHLKDECSEGGGHVVVQLHNFFEAHGSQSAKAISTVRAAATAGATQIILVDGPGGVIPWEMKTAVEEAVSAAAEGGAKIGVSCSDEAELAIASTLEGVKNGASLVQGAINGADRTANLAAVIATAQLRMGRDIVGEESLKGMTSLTRFLDEQCNQPHLKSAPFVGLSAFAHKGGIHVAAVLKNEDTYQHIDPTIVGNQRRVLISELSGRGNIMSKVEEFGMLGQGDKNPQGNPEWKERSGAILKTVKELEQKGYTFEGADASVDLMIRRSMPNYKPPFTIMEYQVFNDDERPTASRIQRWMGGNAGDYGSKSRKVARCKAVVAVQVEDDYISDCDYDDEQSSKTLCDIDDESVTLEVARGNGPVDALAKALKKALIPKYPMLQQLELRDYKVRILDAESATGAMVRVMVEFQLSGPAAAIHHSSREGKSVKGTSSLNRVTWTTVSAGTNIISASFSALVDGYEYHLAEEAAFNQKRMSQQSK